MSRNLGAARLHQATDFFSNNSNVIAQSNSVLLNYLSVHCIAVLLIQLKVDSQAWAPLKTL